MGGFGGGGNNARRQPVATQAEIDADARKRQADADLKFKLEREEVERLRAEKIEGNLSRFNTETSNSNFQNDLRGVVNQSTGNRIAALDNDFSQIARDIRQQQTARGTFSSSRFKQTLQNAEQLLQKSKSDIQGDAQKRFDQRLLDQNSARDFGTRALKAGEEFDIAKNRFDNDVKQAQKNFEDSLNAAGGRDQKNEAFRVFELARSGAAVRFSQAKGVDPNVAAAAAASVGNENDNTNSQGQVGGFGVSV